MIVPSNMPDGLLPNFFWLKIQFILTSYTTLRNICR